MSDLKVEVVEVEEVLPHTGADRLEIAKIKGWYCVTGKGNFKAGDLGVYFPIDSVLPPDLDAQLFPPDSKIKLKNGRIKTTKIRGAISQGLIVPLSDLDLSDLEAGVDITKRLGVTKYEPEAASVPGQMNPQAKRYSNPYFKEYYDLQNAKNYPHLFAEGELVIATEKIHGTNFRAGWVPYVPEGFWAKLKIRLLTWTFPDRIPQWEFVYGSRRIQLKKDADNLYSQIIKQYELENAIPKGCVIYAEIYGGGVQKGYTYGLGQNEHAMVIYEVMQNGQYLDIGGVATFCVLRGLPFVPAVYNGPFNWEKMRELTLGASVLCPQQKVREGIVVRSIKEEINPFVGRKSLKFVSDEYLLKDQSEYH